MLSTLLSVNIFTGRPFFMGARDAHKQHHGNNYSYHRVQNLKKIDSTPMFFLHVTPFQPSPISLLRVHLNGIGNVTIHLNVLKNYEFHTKVGHLWLFLQNLTCTYDLTNCPAQNNLNRMHVLC